MPGGEVVAGRCVDGFGPCVPVRFQPPQAVLRHLREVEDHDGDLALAGAPLVQSGWALVDTGACVSVMRRSIAETLKLPPAGPLTISGIHSSRYGQQARGESMPTYAGTVVIGTEPVTTTFVALEVFPGRMVVGHEEVIGVLGMDILERFRLVVDPRRPLVQLTASAR